MEDLALLAELQAKAAAAGMALSIFWPCQRSRAMHGTVQDMKPRGKEAQPAAEREARRYPMEDLALLAELQAKAAAAGMAGLRSSSCREMHHAVQSEAHEHEAKRYPMEDLALLAELQAKAPTAGMEL